MKNIDQNSMCLCPDGKIRWAAGESKDGAHGMYPAGYAANNERGLPLLYFDGVEVLETPSDLDKLSAWGTDLCGRCSRYTGVQEGECLLCTFLSSTPTKFEQTLDSVTEMKVVESAALVQAKRDLKLMSLAVEAHQANATALRKQLRLQDFIQHECGLGMTSKGVRMPYTVSFSQKDTFVKSVVVVTSEGPMAALTAVLDLCILHPGDSDDSSIREYLPDDLKSAQRYLSEAFIWIDIAPGGNPNAYLSLTIP